VGELDFVLLSEDALLVIEVKGGGISCHDGMWTYTDRNGDEHRSSEGPFRQAGSGLMGLRARLIEALPANRLAGMTFGYGVAFPQAEFGIHSVEWDDRTILDRRRLARRDGLGAWLRQLVTFWRERTRVQGSVPKDLVAELRQLLRPEFDRVPPLSVRVGEVVTRMDELTAEQYGHLDFIEANDHNVIDGGAGTGKTFLAIELVRRETVRNRSVLYTCHSDALARFVRARVPPVARVTTFSELDGPTPSRPCDTLVVDEGQDLMTIDALDRLGREVVGGIEGGRWTIFLDPNLQSHLSRQFDPETLDLVRSMGYRGPLRRNCRNTEEVVLQTRLLTGADLGNPMAGVGPQVSYAYYREREECASLLDHHLRDLAAKGIAPEKITVLSPVGPADSAIGALFPERLRRAIPDDDQIGRTGFATIEEFKGLENDFVALVDIERIESDRDIALLYVGMSRARAGLWVAIHENARAQLSEAIRRRGLDSVAGVGAWR
jgi:hypothetical protein